MLSAVTRGKVEAPELLILYGPDGVGKSTFAASMPNPIFLGSEKGTSNLDVSRLPTPKDFEQCQLAVHELTKEQHDYKTLAIDSLDWMEPLVWDKVCRDNASPSIEKVDGGFGKGYVAALKMWQNYVAMLSELREKRKMNIILLAHSQVKAFQDPQQNAAYDRYQLKLNDKASALFREFADCVLFANYDVATKTDHNKKTLAFGEGARKMYTERRPAFDAKNRFNLPFEMALSWEDYLSAKSGSETVKPETVLKQIRELTAQLADAKLRGTIEGTLKTCESDVGKLLVVLNKVRTLLNA